MLERILQATRIRVELLEPRRREIEERAAAMPPSRGFGAALAASGLQVIAEIKRRSPSAGDISIHLDPATQASRYETGGAAAISVLTEPNFFGGSLADLAAVRAAVEIPILRKDFVIDEVQIHEARAAGADAVLLIVAALDEARLAALLAVGRSVGLDVLVEAHTGAELEIANRCGAQIVGINNRDLHTFKTDLATAERLAPDVGGSIKVAESGVSSPQGAARMAAAGYDAILVGEALVRSADPAAFVAELRLAEPR